MAIQEGAEGGSESGRFRMRESKSELKVRVGDGQHASAVRCRRKVGLTSRLYLADRADLGTYRAFHPRRYPLGAILRGPLYRPIRHAPHRAGLLCHGAG